ncbi:hypothetical protein BH09ACT10_BH09ACT10_29890 [soil metagenome]
MPRSRKHAPVATPESANDATLGSAGGANVDTNDVHAIRSLPQPVQGQVIDAFSLSLHDVFITAIPVVFLAFVIAFFIKEIPLRTREGTPAPAILE